MGASHHLESSQQLGKVGIVLIPIFLMSKLRLARALWCARDRVVVGACSVQRPCPFQPVDSSSGEVKDGSPRKGCLWGGFQALPASKLKQPVTLGGGEKGRMDWTLSIVLYCLANALYLLSNSTWLKNKSTSPPLSKSQILRLLWK